VIESGAACDLIFQFSTQNESEQCFVILTIETPDGILVAHLNSLEASGSYLELSAGVTEMAFHLSSLPLSEGSYSLHIGVYDRSGTRLASWHAQPMLRVRARPAMELPVDKPVGILSLAPTFSAGSSGS
jgi:hypothetical protein